MNSHQSEKQLVLLFIGLLITSALTILEADVRFAQLLHSMATKVMISNTIVRFGPTVWSHKIV